MTRREFEHATWAPMYRNLAIRNSEGAMAVFTLNLHPTVSLSPVGHFFGPPEIGWMKFLGPPDLLYESRHRFSGARQLHRVHISEDHSGLSNSFHDLAANTDFVLDVSSRQEVLARSPS